MPFQAAMKLTMPQIIMLNHAATVTWKRTELRSEHKRKKEDKQETDDPIIFNGKRASEMSEIEWDMYYAQGFM